MAWERREREVEIVLGIPHQGTVTMEWALSFAKLYSRLAHTRRFFLSFARGNPIDVARNQLVKDVLRLKADWLFLLDSDVLVPEDIIDRLMRHNLPVVSALYYRRHKPVHPAMWVLSKEDEKCPVCGKRRKPTGKYNPIIRFKRDSLVKCDVAGCGCVLIHRRVLEKIKPPWFQWTLGPVRPWRTQEEMGVSEDFYFYEKVGEAGFDVVVDTSIVCQHEGTIKFGEPSPELLELIKYGGVYFPEV